MSAKSYLVGIRIEGWGSDTTKEGIVYYFDGGYAPDSSTAYEWVPALTRIPDSIETSINWITGEWNISSFSFELSASDDIASALLRTKRSGSVITSNGASQSSTTISVTGSPTLNVPYYYRDETLAFTANSGGGAYTISRGIFGSTSGAIDAGAIFTDHPTFWPLRLVELITHDTVTGTETVRWTGYLTEITGSEDGGRIYIQAREAYQRWRQAQANREPINFNASRSGWTVTSSGFLKGIVPGITRVNSRSSTGLIYIQIGDLVVAGTYNAEIDTVVSIDQLNVAEQESFEIPEDGGPPKTQTAPAWEVLLWRGNASPLTGDDKSHPIRIAKALLGGGGLDPHWTIGVDYIDYAAFDALIAATPDLKVDQFILGVGGEPYSPFEEAEKLMRAYGYAPSITDDGKYSVVQFALLGLKSLQSANDAEGVSPYRDGPLQWKPPLSSGVSEVIAEVGRFPGIEPVRRVVRTTGGSSRSALIGSRDRVVYDVPYVERKKAEQVLLALRDCAAIAYGDFPRLRIRVRDNADLTQSYDLGASVRLADLGTLETAWWVTQDGQRLTSAELSGRLDAVGIITARQLDLQTMTYILTLTFSAYATQQIIRERAPAGEVVSVAANSITIDTFAFYFTDFSAPADASFFTAGDEIALWTRSGVKRTTTYVSITSISGDTLTVTADFPVTPVAGDIIRLAPSSTYSNDARYSVTTRPYVFFADAARTISHDGDTLAADIYGGSLGISN